MLERLRTRRVVRRTAAVTTALTFALILLGVYTAAAGAGLSCSAQWPLCSGGVLPQTLPDLIEWSHRLVAMVTGFAILGTAAGVWRTYRARRIRYAALLALVVTPVQVLLGRETVVGAYTPAVQTAHHGAAMLIFTALTATTLWAYEADRSTPRPAATADDGADPAGADAPDDATAAASRPGHRSDD